MHPLFNGKNHRYPRYPGAEAVIRVVNGATVQPFFDGPLAEPKRTILFRDITGCRIYANPKPVWVAAETSTIWGFLVKAVTLDGNGFPVSLDAMRTILPGGVVEFVEIRLNVAGII